jgi:hypothetical protein
MQFASVHESAFGTKQAETKSFVLLMFDSEGRNGNPDAARVLSSKVSRRPKAAAVIRQHGIEPG